MRVDDSVRGAEGTALSMLDVVRYATGNLVLDDEGDWWAMYRLRGVTYDLLSVSGKKEVFSAIESALGTLSHRVKLLSVVRNFRQEDYIRGLKAMNNTHVWHRLQDEVAATIGGNRPLDREFYMSIRLRPTPGRISEWVDLGSRKIDRIAKRIWKVPLDFRLAELEEMHNIAANMAGRFGNLIMKPTTPLDLMWLMRRGPYRAVGEPPVLDEWTPKHVKLPGGGSHVLYKPSLGDLRTLVGDVPWEAEFGKLAFYHGDGIVSHQRFLSVSSMPADKLIHPGSEWAYMDLPVDVCLDFDVVPPQAAERQRKTKSRKAKEQMKHVQQGGGSMGVRLSEAARADQAAEIQHNQNKPLLFCHATFALAAESQPRLESITDDVKRHFKRLQIGISLARSNQIEAFSDGLPVGPRRLTDFREPIDSAALAGSMPVGDAQLGDGVGPYIGYPIQQQNRVIAYDPALPMKKGMSGACAVVGGLGAGKTMLYQCMMLTNALAGRQCLMIDPKGDSEALDNVPAIRGGLRKIRVGADDETTSMPILSVYPPGWDRRTEELLQGFQLDIMQTLGDPAKQNCIRLVTSDFMRRTHGRDRRIAGLLENYVRFASDHSRSEVQREKAKEVRDELEYWMHHPLASTVLCDEAQTGENLSREKNVYPVTVLQTFNLTLPSKEDLERGKLNEAQRVGQALQSVVAASATQMASEHRLSRSKPFKLLGFDEAWRFLANSDGAALLNYLIREGRSQNVATFIMTQLWRDIADVRDLISIRFMGRSQSEEDIRLGLEIMGLDAEQHTIELVKKFKNGDFIHQDMQGRANIMHFQPTPDEWRVQLDSNPEEERKEAAIPVGVS